VAGYQRSLDPEDEGSMDLRNVGILPQHYTASQRRRKPQISHQKLCYVCTTNDTYTGSLLEQNGYRPVIPTVLILKSLCLTNYLLQFFSFHCNHFIKVCTWQTITKHFSLFRHVLKLHIIRETLHTNNCCQKNPEQYKVSKKWHFKYKYLLYTIRLNNSTKKQVKVKLSPCFN
jgi:hypothetical protein